MATGHIIDEVVFDLSFDSIAIAREHESHISSWLTDQLLPIVDSILNTYDDAQTVLRMDHLELDLGDISSDDFYNEIIRKVSEQLTDQLRDARNSSPFEASSTENSSSGARPSPSLSPSSSPSPSIRQVSQAQSDSERLIDFLLTGNMAWHIDILATNAHEKMLAQVLQQTGESFLQFLQRSSAATRNVLIRRLVKQFSPQHLAVLLAKLAPTSARLILDLMIVIQSVSIQTQSDTTQPEELTEWLWMLTFETLLAEVQESDLQTAVIQKVFRKFEKLQVRVPDLIASKVIKIAENLSRKQKINTELPKILLDLINVDGKQLINKDITNQIAPASEALISNEIQITNNPLPPTVISSKQTKQDQIATSTVIYQRIVHAIANADIPGIDAKALMHGELADSAYPGEPAGSGEIRKQLLLLIQQAEMRAHFAVKLPERVLLDIVYLLSPQAAALTEQLLAQSTILFQATDATKQNSQSNVMEWQQQLWAGSLAALVTAQNKTLDPVDHLQALARWFSTTQEASVVMQAWYTALAKSKNYGTLYNMLQYLIVQQDQHLFNVGAEVSAESELLVETLTKISESLPYQQLYQRLSATHSDKVITVDLQTAIGKLTTDSPAELRRIFQALRRGEFFLAAAKLQGAELRSLTTALIQMESSDIDEVQQDFIQAIESHAVQAKDQAIYYQRVFEALLQGEVVDLEAAALQRQYESTSMPAPTTVSTISEKAHKVHKASVPIKNLQTISKAIYQRIVQAIVKANIPGIDAKALAHGDLAELTNLGEIRKQFLLLIQQAEIRAQLAEKLPERVLLDIVYLLSPHAAALTEQLLAQSTILFRVTDTTKQSSHSSQSSLSSVMAWQQQLWVGSLAALTATQETNLDPADYLQALARWFSTTHEAMVVMQAWYTALAKSKNYGTLYNMLQQLIVQQDQHLFNVGAEVSAESELLVETQTRRSESPAYQKLYQRLSAAQSDKVVVDLQIVIEKLATDSPAELRRIFQALRSGELILAAAKLQGVELRSLTTALIQMESTDIDGFQQDFSKAIERQAVQAKDQVIYYQKVLDALLQGEIVDLEAFALQIAEEPKSGEESEELMEASESPAYQQLYQRLSATQSDKVKTVDLQTVIDKLATDSPEELHRVFQALRSGELILAAAKLQGAELRSLTTALIQMESSDLGEVQQDFILAIERHAAQAKDQVIYYQKVLDALLQGEIVDLEALVSQTSEEPKSGEKSEELMEVSESPAYQQLYQRLSATQSDKVKTIDLQTVIDELATDSPEELRRVFQALRSGELILTAAKLQGAELRSLTTALIQMESTDIDEVQQDFVQAIERHAAQAIDQAVYYQRVLKALLQGDVVDMEAIALQRQYQPTSMPVPASTPTAVSTISEKVQSASIPLINLQTISVVIYKRILQAIAKANIPDIDVKALVHGELASLNDSANQDEIRKQLLSLIQQAEMRVQLADKLPERALLDIVYLLSPHAAALTEQLLAQSTTLFQATNTTKQSSVATWQQQLWIGSLSALITGQIKTLDPTDYLQALVSWFSPSQDTAAVLQTWYTALAQSQKYGTLYNMLQQLIAQQDQHVLNVGTEVSAESEPLVETLTKVSESPAYHQLYQRLSATQSGEVKIGDLQTVIDKLATDSPEELRRIFQVLRRGELTLAAANLKGVELQSLVVALIKTDSTKIGEVQQDFVQAIERYAAQATDQVVYYQLVFEALLQGEVVDLETFALKRVLENNMPVAAQPNATDNISPDQEVLESIVSVKKPALIILDEALGVSSEADVTEEIYINNAGQVLAAPYLPRLFSALKLMEDGDFVDRSAAERAVHLLQFMVNEQTQSPEYQLLLNKILCGITTGIPICREITISEQERALIEGFIKGMIQNWKTIGETTISGLRQTFLQRKGRLQLKEGMWYLTIEPGTFDMLLDGLPWSFSVIKHAWMDRAIHVTWR